MELPPHQLEALGFELLEKLPHSDLVPFIRKYMKRRTSPAILLHLFTIIFLGLTSYSFIAGLRFGKVGLGDLIADVGLGFALSFALVPLHEYIHVLAYQSQGAKNTSYGANLRKFYFMALADGFVASRKEFRVVALAPFFCITLLFGALVFFLSPEWQLTIYATLFAHTAMCSGDFGLLSFFAAHPNREIVTYDDVPNQVSYFYARRLGPIEPEAPGT